MRLGRPKRAGTPGVNSGRSIGPEVETVAAATSSSSSSVTSSTSARAIASAAKSAASAAVRIRAALPTLHELRGKGARLVLLSHLGRPKGAPEAKYSLTPVVDRLAELLGRPVTFAQDTVGESAKAAVAGMADGDVVSTGSTAQVLLGSPAFAPQVAKILAPLPLLTVDAVRALRGAPA